MSLDEIRGRLEAAPHGDWYIDDGAVWVDHSDGERASSSGLTGELPIWAEGAAEFIANAPEDMRRLLAAVEAVFGLANTLGAKPEHRTTAARIRDVIDEALNHFPGASATECPCAGCAECIETFRVES